MGEARASILQLPATPTMSNKQPRRGPGAPQSPASLFGRRLPPVLEAERERALTLEYRRTQSPGVFQLLVESNLRLVVMLARAQDSTRGRWLPDLVQEGCLGLIEAVRRFDPNKGVRLGSYAVFWIRAFLMKFKLENARVVRGGRTRAARAAFFRGEPAPAELPLDAPGAGREDDRSLGDLLADPGPPADIVLEAAETRERASRCLRSLARTLEPRERTILAERLLAEHPKPLRALGERFAVSGERVRQIERDLLARLRDQVVAGPVRLAA
jgi:RNA polymerase sigma-32 factor